MSDPLASVIEGILSALIESGAHLLDPEQRAQAVRDAVEAERAKWVTLDPTTANAMLDELARRHHVEPLRSVDATRPVDPAPLHEDDGS